jgi:hypothetical protein
MYGQGFRIPDEPQYVFGDVVASHRRNLPFEFKLALGRTIPVSVRERREIRLVTQQVVYDQDLSMLDLLLDRLISAKSLFIVGERKFFSFGLGHNIKHKGFENYPKF